MSEVHKRRPRTTILILFILCAMSWIAVVRLYVNQRDLEFRVNELELAPHPNAAVIYDCEDAPTSQLRAHHLNLPSLDYQ